MALTLLAIPFIVLGVFLGPYTQGDQRCVAVRAASASALCFEQGSNMPETIKYGLVAVGFGLLYLGRSQIKRRQGK
jgi:hypothetical protein